MVSARRPGRSTLGCLVLLALLAFAGYLAVNLGGAYWRFYQFRDAMAQQVRFADRDSSDTIVARLQAQADSLDLPPDARHVHVRRTSRGITIWSEYTETIQLLGVEREIDFLAHAEKTF